MRGHLSPIAALSLSALLFVGCQTRPGYTQRDIAPMFDEFEHARSLTLTSPVVQTSRLTSDNREHWYTGRRDVGPYVSSGYVTIRYEQSMTYTRDSQRIYGDRVYDRYDQTTYRRTYRESAR